MLILRSFINLFVVPVVSFYVYHKRVEDEMKPTFKSFVLYCIFVSINIPVTRCFTFFIRMTTGMNMEADSSYYTVLALLSAYFIPYIIECVKRFMESPKDVNSTETKASDGCK